MSVRGFIPAQADESRLSNYHDELFQRVREIICGHIFRFAPKCVRLVRSVALNWVRCDVSER